MRLNHITGALRPARIARFSVGVGVYDSSFDGSSCKTNESCSRTPLSRCYRCIDCAEATPFYILRSAICI